MKNSCFIVFTVMCSFLFSQNDKLEKLKPYFDHFPNQTQLSIAIIENGIPSYYGVIKENDSLYLIQNSTKLFEIGSITKVFTATILAQLIVDGKLKETATVNQFYSFKFNTKTKIKLTQLANHTSGIPRLPSNLLFNNYLPDNPYKNYNSDALETYLKSELKLNTTPGMAYDYSNTSAGLLGYTLGRSQKSSYSKLLQELIFDRYQMTNSFVSKTGNETNLVRGLNAEGKMVENWDWDVLAGAGCIVSTTEDLVKFALTQFDTDNKATVLTHLPTFTVNNSMKTALGWHLVTSQKNSKEYIWHNGATGGYTSSMALDKEQKNGVIILSNISSPDGTIDKICFDLIAQQ
jgi:CubicO group peptidase (beta-lactamase class C family)